jgi:energy-coupling factor transporter transmembrane protein EcfT
MALFFIIKNPWISLRNAFPSVLGLALLIDLIFRYVAKLNILKSILITGLCFIFYYRKYCRAA